FFGGLLTITCGVTGIGRLSSRRQSRAPALARQSRQCSRRRRFEHKECFTESYRTQEKRFSFPRSGLLLFVVTLRSRLTWAVLAEGTLFDASLLPDFLNILLEKVLQQDNFILFCLHK